MSAAVAHPRQVAARLVVDEPHPRVAIQVAGEIAEPAVDELENARVDFDAGDAALVEHQRRQDVAAAAGPDDDDLRRRPEVVDDVGDVVLEVLNGGGIAVEGRQLGAGVGIDVEVQLARGQVRGSVVLKPQPDGRIGRVGSPITRMRENGFQRSTIGRAS